MPLKVAFYVALIRLLNLVGNLLNIQFLTITNTTLVLDLDGLLLTEIMHLSGYSDENNEI